jgi:hypothetical protein
MMMQSAAATADRTSSKAHCATVAPIREGTFRKDCAASAKVPTVRVRGEDKKAISGRLASGIHHPDVDPAATLLTNALLFAMHRPYRKRLQELSTRMERARSAGIANHIAWVAIAVGIALAVWGLLGFLLG